MMNSKIAKFNIGFIAKRWYLEKIQDQDNQSNIYETVNAVTQFQKVDINSETIVTDLHIFNQFRAPYIFTIENK